MALQLRALVEAAHRHLAEGRLQDALRSTSTILAVAPDEPNALLIEGIVAHRLHRHADAQDRLKRALAASPEGASHQAIFWLGNVERALGRPEAAIDWYEKVERQRAGHVDARYNKALCFLQIGKTEDAAREFMIVGRAHPYMPDAVQAVVNCAGLLARTAAPSSMVTATARPASAALVSFIVCSITPWKLDSLRQSLARALGGARWELIHIPDASSLSEGNNRGMQQAKGDLLVFCHDDIEILCDDFHRRLADACADADVVGVAGTTLANGPAVAWAGWPHVHGRITHIDPGGHVRPSISSLAPARVDGAQALDGVFIAVRRDVAEEIRFDAETFDGFHFYDLDFSYRAFRHGKRVRIQSDLLIGHYSRGTFDDVYWRFARRLTTKFPELQPRAKPDRAAFFEIAAEDREHARRMQQWIASWLDREPDQGT